MMKLDIINLDGKKLESIDLPKSVFEAPVREDIMHRVVNWQLAKRRSGTASSLSRGQVSRTKAKMYRQKGTGNARHGSKRSNIFVGGAQAFGPKPRSFAFSLPKQIRALGLQSAISGKAKDKKLVILDEATAASPKTKEMSSKLKQLSLDNALFIVDSNDTNFELATRNIPHVKVLPTQGANVYDILHADNLVITKSAVPMLEARINRS